MAFAWSSPPVGMASNLLLNYVNGLASHLGVSCQPGQESVFLSSLRGNGLGEGDVQVLARLLNGKAVKLHEYQSVVQDLERLGDSHLAETALTERLDLSRRTMEGLHDQAMRELADRGLEGEFLNEILLETLVAMQSGYRFYASVNDVSREFRHFVEEKQLDELVNLAVRYAKASAAVAKDRSMLEAVRK